MTIRVRKPGFFTTVQDLGRYGYAHLGISPAGAADPLSFRIANLLVGNDEDENVPALEMTLLGATLELRRAPSSRSQAPVANAKPVPIRCHSTQRSIFPREQP